jgi:hypothetical protein
VSQNTLGKESLPVGVFKMGTKQTSQSGFKDMIGKGAVLLATLVGISGVLQSEGIEGLGFLAITVPTPIWFILLLAIVPTGETLRVLRGFIRSYGPSKNAQSDTN